MGYALDITVLSRSITIVYTLRTMESLVDIVTTSFQAVLAIAVVFTAGYALNSKQDAVFAAVSYKGQNASTED